MASSSSLNAPLALILSLSLLLPSALGGVICEELPEDLCAFAVSSSSKRCVLESYQRGGGETEYQCRSSEVSVEVLSDWVETDGCVRDCGVDRGMVGISSDSLGESQLTAKLCSPNCYNNCPNIVDLYFNLAAGEGAFLPDLCKARRANHHRSMAELLSSGVAPAPIYAEAAVTSDGVYSPPAPAPMSLAPIYW